MTTRHRVNLCVCRAKDLPTAFSSFFLFLLIYMRIFSICYVRVDLRVFRCRPHRTSCVPSLFFVVVTFDVRSESGTFFFPLSLGLFFFFVHLLSNLPLSFLHKSFDSRTVGGNFVTRHGPTCVGRPPVVCKVTVRRVFKNKRSSRGVR